MNITIFAGDELTTEGTEVSPEDEQTAEHKPKEGEETPADDVNDQTDNEGYSYPNLIPLLCLLAGG